VATILPQKKSDKIRELIEISKGKYGMPLRGCLIKETLC